MNFQNATGRPGVNLERPANARHDIVMTRVGMQTPLRCLNPAAPQCCTTFCRQWPPGHLPPALPCASGNLRWQTLSHAGDQHACSSQPRQPRQLRQPYVRQSSPVFTRCNINPQLTLSDLTILATGPPACEEGLLSRTSLCSTGPPARDGLLMMACSRRPARDRLLLPCPLAVVR